MGTRRYPGEPGHVCFNVDGISDAVFSLAHYRASMDPFNLHKLSSWKKSGGQISYLQNQSDPLVKLRYYYF